MLAAQIAKMTFSGEPMRLKHQPFLGLTPIVRIQRTRWEPSKKMGLVSTTCAGMFGNGLLIGLAPITISTVITKTQQARNLVSLKSCVGDVGLMESVDYVVVVASKDYRAWLMM